MEPAMPRHLETSAGPASAPLRRRAGSRRHALVRRGTSAAAALIIGWMAHPAAAQSPAPKVVATIKPVHALVAQVMGETGAPNLIVDGTASPHNYALKPSDARKLQAATLVFRISESFEAFTAKGVKSLPKEAVVVNLEDAPGIKLLKRRNDPNFEAHDHAGDAKGHWQGHSHGHAPAKSGDARDGHLWLDPDNAVAMIGQIATTLSSRDPARAAAYQANAAKAKAAVTALTQDLERELKPAAGRPYIVFHDAYQYLEARFGLTPVGSVTINPEVPPSGKRLTELRKKVTALGAQCVFAEPNFEMKVVQSIIEGTPVRTGTLDPEAALLSPGPDLYAELMRKLAQGLKACLAPSS
jgi:zinc transport system substrate-binding protein